ncbi:MAG: 30S ribosomal protein S4 [Planctomycetota bacterium]|nr:MAG: 30S ribosomal protein S4 [Planctomycetota bacterium]
MAREHGPTTRFSRREGVNLMLKPIRDLSGKMPLEREYKNYPPGMHIWRRGKSSAYGVRLREKQKVKRYYGVLEKQFQRYFQMAERSRENTGVALLKLLERRLDNVVYKTRFIAGRRGARQAIVHGHIEVNGRKVDRPSYLVKPGDTISIRKREKSEKYARAQMQLIEGVSMPPQQSWLSVDADKLTATVVSEPSREDVLIPVEEQLIVEFCSR